MGDQDTGNDFQAVTLNQDHLITIDISDNLIA